MWKAHLGSCWAAMGITALKSSNSWIWVLKIRTVLLMGELGCWESAREIKRMSEMNGLYVLSRDGGSQVRLWLLSDDFLLNRTSALCCVLPLGHANRSSTKWLLYLLWGFCKVYCLINLTLSSSWRYQGEIPHRLKRREKLRSLENRCYFFFIDTESCDWQVAWLPSPSKVVRFKVRIRLRGALVVNPFVAGLILSSYPYFNFSSMSFHPLTCVLFCDGSYRNWNYFLLFF